MGECQDPDFPERHWEPIKREAESGGGAAAIAYIDGAEEDPKRLSLYSFARQALGGREWAGKNLDTLVEVTRAGIDASLAYAETVEDQARREGLVDFANVLSYNLAADLAECWPGDVLPREQRHFEQGLRAAEDCLRWREQLKKGDYPFAVAHWARGMHLISLGRAAEAAEAMARAVTHAEGIAREQGRSTEVVPNGNFMVLLNNAYLGLAQALSGEAGGTARYDEACAAFEATDDESLKEDANFGLQQLRHVGAKFLSR